MLVAGVLSLVAYGIYAWGLTRWLRQRDGGRWPAVARLGAVGGLVLAACGIAAEAVLLAAGRGDLADETVRRLFDLQTDARLVAGGFAAFFALGVGVSARRSATLPGPLCFFALAITLPLAVGPLAAASDQRPLQVLILVAYGLFVLWIFLTGLWLAGDEATGIRLVQRSASLVLVIAAGLVGLALLAVPGSTEAFFAWGLAPEPLAAFAGGVYVGSAVVYLAGLRSPEHAQRGLAVGMLVLSLTVLVVSIAHRDVFDFGRLQAWAWMVLFVAFTVVSAVLVTIGPRRGGRAQERIARWVVVTLAAATAGLAIVGIALWIDPGAVAASGPFELPPLGGRFAGSWIVLLAVLAGHAAVSGRVQEARLAGVALVALPLGALAAAARVAGDLDAGPATGYVVALAVLSMAGVGILRSLPGQPSLNP
jgi:hypothetical protein